ncbi:MAG: hypothetical protein H6811_05170 [Phycisphaeraceae bacterium]|nr:hypothetical protein [Phycisphaeraceae bacterium]
MTSRAWSEEQIARFHDGEMEGPQSAAFEDDLIADPSLRARLKALERADVLVARVLSRPAEQQSRVADRWRARLGAPLAIAAAIALLTAVPLLRSPPRSTPVESAPLVVAHVSEPAPRRLAILTLPPGASLASWAPEPNEPSEDPRPAERIIARAVEAGDTITAITEIDRLSPGQRDAAYRDLARTVKSGRAAEEFLDSIEPERQVAICRAWASDGAFRPVTLARLRTLREMPGLEASTRDAVEALAAQPELDGWLKSYGLARAP